jgi:UDP-3-O-[3-hydroxymyristoyl] glucosamine N-acyltransferase
MIGYYFIQNKYRFVNGNERIENDKYSKEMTSQSAANIRMKESFDTEENENENLIHTNKNGTNIAMTYKKLLKYFF